MRGGLVLLVAAGLVAGCGGGQDQEGSQAPIVAQAVNPPAPTATARANQLPDGTTPAATAEAKPKKLVHRRPQSSGAILSAADKASFAQLASQLGGSSGVAVSALGPGKKVEQAGSLSSGVAWSTSKVPIAMAVIAAGKQQSEQQDLMQAITESDNAAAERLWSALGAGDAAAQAADQQLEAAGDTTTRIESRALRGSGYTPFGQTEWSLAGQARYMAGMVCVGGSQEVLSLMNEVVAGQRWGLGAAGVDAQFKGGWGPGARPGVGGGYLDRQMGVITVKGRPLAVSIATLPADGSHESGTRNLTAIARWLVSHADVRTVPARASC